ncbi:5'-3' exoribonuclease [Naegleria gruberi]|uniref:5'-3' exoribonuclease n=1 Tax=Naegleria gruberi TaxID=5762 RepID=D2VA47_NAEGR|nr:5'-3' exoribonuclease [Naegleria gruberi]EFC46365.1 5'-3' exoribonuclease [Naegleria gruberi]|eukprot:XP_002679109.1 5'-3' exoribonuclease [Naegleria gruberi strain NEG-M]
MGVPGFIYWLVTNVIDTNDKKDAADDKIVYPINKQSILVQDILKQRVDNFYIDLNGLIHPCCHPQTGKKPENEDDMMKRITAELLQLARTVQPNNLFYIAVDGVAPAAKQEQQRHRRFVAISENEQKLKFIGRIQSEITKEKDELTKEIKESEVDKIQQREKLLDSAIARMEAKKNHWDHNVISPGTPFMMKCMSTVHQAAKLIATEFPHIKVIVSDSSVPGEGEHKILSYMKREKAINSKEFSEMLHVVHGLDADLIMLTSLIGLPKIFSYRDSENVRMNKRDKELFNISELGRHFARVIYSSIAELDTSSKSQNIDWSNANFVSDVVLLLMFVGNDFLPNVPSLVMHNHAASIIMYSYAKYLLQCMEESGLGDNFDPRPHYLVDYTNSSMINIKNMIKAMQSIREESVIGMFAKLYHSTIRHYQRQEDIYQQPSFIEDMKGCYSGSNLKLHKFDKMMKTISKNNASHKPFEVVFKILREYFKNHKKKNLRSLKEPEQLIKACFYNPAEVIHEINTSIILKYTDEIHQEYYHKKFGDSSLLFRKTLVKEYLRGIVWAFNYYSYNDPPSWYWRYPEHYAPVMCDILDCYDEINDEYIKDITTFEKGEPLTAYQQLISILPKESMEACLPKTYTDILNNPKLDKFFPKEFEKDGNFSGIVYKAVSLLPSIDLDLVKNITKEIDPLLSEEESRKNKFGIDVIYTAVDSEVNKKLSTLEDKVEKEEKFKGDDTLLSGVFSKIDTNEMVFGSEVVASELKASVAAYKFSTPTVPIQDAYKFVTTNSIPKAKLVSTLTRQLGTFKQVGGFVSMSEDQDLSNLSNNFRIKFPRKTTQGSKRAPNRNEDYKSNRPSKASKRDNSQKTPHQKKESTTEESNEMQDEEKSISTERKPIRARVARNKRAEIAEAKAKVTAEKKRTSEDSNEGPAKKKKKKNKSTKQEAKVETKTEEKKEASSSTEASSSAATETTATSESTATTTAAAASAESKTKKKRKRQKKNKGGKPATTGASSSTTTESTPAPEAAVDASKNKLKESTNAKFKALLSKFTVKK